MLEKIKRVFYKLDLDPSVLKTIDLFDYHHVIKKALILNGFFIDHRQRSWKGRFILPSFSFGLTTLSAVMLCFNIYHTLVKDNITDFSESVSYLLITSIILLQIIWSLLHSKNYFSIIDTLLGDFENAKNYPEDYKAIFYKNQLLVWQMTVTWMVVPVLIIICFMMINWLEIYNHQFIEEYGEGKTRPMMFPIWLPFMDVYKSPQYEIFFLIQYLMLAIVLIIYASYVSFNILFMTHPIGQLELVDLGLEQLFRGNPSKVQVKQRVGRIVERHNRIYNFCNETAQAFGLILLYQILLTPVMLCVTAFQVAEGLENGELRFIFVLLFFGTMIQLSIPCILGSMLTEKASETSDVGYFCKWEDSNLSKFLSNDMQIFLMRGNRPLTIDALGVIPVCMETFSSVIRTAGSYFTMLRQVSEEKNN